MLREDVIDAVAVGQFHVWPVARIEEGIEILTGVRAGTRGPDGKFEEATVFALVDARLRELAMTMKEFE
jgi:predicted ATP-dependent protease